MHPLRKLLPAKRGSETLGAPLPVTSPPKKRSTLACENCREKKTKVRYDREGEHIHYQN